MVHHPMIVWNDHAWLFTGDRNVWKFSLVIEKWQHMPCRFNGRNWPYHSSFVQGHGVAVPDGVMYVFGDTDRKTLLGTNIFVSLNLRSLEWKHLSGVSDCVTQTFFPNLRRFTALWAVPQQKRLYLLQGAASRSVAKMSAMQHGSTNGAGCTHDDLWLYDVVENSKSWSRDRLRGNYSCPRSEMDSVGRQCMSLPWIA